MRILSLLVASAIGVLLTGIGAHVALSLGVMPWPIVFSTAMAYGLLSLFAKSDATIHEINIAQCGGSVGGLIAAAISFTLPAFFFIQQSGIEIDIPNLGALSTSCAFAAAVGAVCSIPLKRTLIDEEGLPFPAGVTAAELLRSMDSGGSRAWRVLLIMSLTAVFVVAKDFGIEHMSGASWIVFCVPWPLAIGVGYVVGPRVALPWFAGGCLAIVMEKFLSHQLSSDSGILRELAFGIILGTGVSSCGRFVLLRIPKIIASIRHGSANYIIVYVVLCSGSVASLAACGMNLFVGVATIACASVAVIIAARMTGETNINPMEQFGLFAALQIAAFFALFSLRVPVQSLLVSTMFVTIAAGVAGDVGHDYKSAAIVGTRFRDVWVSTLLVAILAGLLGPLAVILLYQTGETRTIDQFAAPQARLIASTLSGLNHAAVFSVGFVVSLVLETYRASREKSFLGWFTMMPFGIGILLGPQIGIWVFIGTAIWIIFPSHRELGLVIATALIAGDGFVGFAKGSLAILGMNSNLTSIVIIGAALVALRLLGIYRKKNRAA